MSRPTADSSRRTAPAATVSAPPPGYPITAPCVPRSTALGSSGRIGTGVDDTKRIATSSLGSNRTGTPVSAVPPGKRTSGRGAPAHPGHEPGGAIPRGGGGDRPRREAVRQEPRRQQHGHDAHYGPRAGVDRAQDRPVGHGPDAPAR